MEICHQLYSSLLLVLLIASFCQFRCQRDDQQELDIVLNLPGQPPANFRHYAGYIKLRQNDEKAHFYWFFEAEGGNSSKKPLLLWLNGGPGCSSIAYGAAQELGPFLIGTNGTKLVQNNFAWNKAANLLFVESPVGVGFSYTNNSEDLLKLGDRVTAEDNYAFLLGWFNRFPSYKSHDFYLSGESYAGHYVPQLANIIYERNKVNRDTHINFKGIMIGNPAINDASDQSGLIEYAWSHAIISDNLHRTIRNECNFKTKNQTVGCVDAFRRFIHAYSDIDIYSIYTPTCLSSSGDTSKRPLRDTPRFFSSHDFFRSLPLGYDPCTDNYAEKYFNREDVQRALHANVTKLFYKYTPCSDVIFSQWNDSADSVLDILRKLINAGFRVWIYSGDADGRLPVTSTRESINAMGLTVKEEWRPWFHKRQVAGWVEEYVQGLTLATVHGAGHEVPVLKPSESLSLLSHFLAGKSLPSSRY